MGTPGSPTKAQNGPAVHSLVYFATFFALAQRALWAAAILARASGESWCLLGGVEEPFGLPGPRLATVSPLKRDLTY
jgi:hypothetical protein